MSTKSLALALVCRSRGIAGKDFKTHHSHCPNDHC